MYIKKLFFPGEFYEAFIYMQKLLLFNEGGGFFFVDLEQLAKILDRRLEPKVKSLATYLFARNDWLAGTQFSTLIKNPEMLSSFLQVLDAFPDEIQLEEKFIEYIEDIKISDLLDVTVYNQRLYVGTDEGLYHADLELNSREISVKGELEKRHDLPCIQVNVKYGAINISCGNDGLFTHFDEFQILDDQVKNHASIWRQIQDKSLRTSWLFDDMINYSTSNKPTLLEVDRSDKNIRDRFQSRSRERIATSIRDMPSALSTVFERFELQSDTQSEDFLYVYNTQQKFFVQTPDRRLFSIPLNRSEDTANRPFVAKRSQIISQEPLSRILNATLVRRNTILELYDSVQLLSGGKLTKLVQGEVLSVKSYPSSKRFQNLVTIIAEEGVFLISLFDEREYIRQPRN